MHHAPPPILLTSSIIAHDPGVKLKNEHERLSYTIQSIEQWLRIDPRISIVICDGSNYNLQATLKGIFEGSNIEYLSFQNDLDNVKKYGRGYGEGEIVKFSLSKSSIIKKAGCFTKCTSKLWVSNFSEISKWWKDHFLCHGVFKNTFSPFKPTTLKYIDTRFYMTSCEFYSEYLIDAHSNIRTDSGHGLEECFHSIATQRNLKEILSPIPPIIEGVGGGTGINYNNSTKRIWKEKLKVALNIRNKKISNLFISK